VSLRFSIPITLRSLGRGFHTVPDEDTEREPSATPPPIDYAPFLDATRRVGLWLLDVARTHTTDALDQTAIDRVQRAFLASLTDAREHVRDDVSEEDLLVVAGILITAFEADLGAPGLSDAAGALYSESAGGLDTIQHALVAAVGECTAQQLAATAMRAPAKRRTRVVLPIVVRRRPRVVDEDVIADLLSAR